MKRLLILALLASVWGGAAATANAGAFGICYSPNCGACSAASLSIRPYNAFSSVTCGVANFGGPPAYNYPQPNGGCGSGCGSGCGLGCGLFKGGCGLGGLFHKNCQAGYGTGDYNDVNGHGAFGSSGPKVAFFGTPVGGGKMASSCSSMGCAWGGGSVPVPGYSPPAAPYMSPPPAATAWLPARPFPGMYGIPPQAVYMPMYAMPMMPYPPQAAPQAAPKPAPQAVSPVSYYYPAMYQGYQPMMAYPMPQYQNWQYAPAYWGQR